MANSGSDIDALKKLREPFPSEAIGLLPRPYKKDSKKGKCSVCGGFHGLPAVHLSYVGHAALTDRLLAVDPFWNWEPLATDERGLPLKDEHGGMWIKLTVCGMTRLGYGDSGGKKGPDATKELIGDALRNAAMRFGCALDLWHKGDLPAYHDDEDEPTDGDHVDNSPPSQKMEQVQNREGAKQDFSRIQKWLDWLGEFIPGVHSSDKLDQAWSAYEEGIKKGFKKYEFDHLKAEVDKKVELLENYTK